MTAIDFAAFQHMYEEWIDYPGYPSSTISQSRNMDYV